MLNIACSWQDPRRPPWAPRGGVSLRGGGQGGKSTFSSSSEPVDRFQSNFVSKCAGDRGKSHKRGCEILHSLDGPAKNDWGWGPKWPQPPRKVRVNRILSQNLFIFLYNTLRTTTVQLFFPHPGWLVYIYNSLEIRRILLFSSFCLAARKFAFTSLKSRLNALSLL